MATGHAKNVANFETVVITVTNLGAVYNPSQPLILPAALQSKLTAAKEAMQAVDLAEAAKKIAVNSRAAEFEEIIGLTVNVKRAAEVDVNDAAFTADLASIIRRMRGERAGEIPEDNPETLDIDESNKTHSVSARGYDNQVAYFADLIALLQTQPAYNPNDTEVQVETLETKLLALENKNNAAKTANAALGSAHDARDAVLYDPDTGVLKLVKLIKAQLARKPGTESAAYQQIVALDFRKY
jgi:hypothetical protein